MTAPPLTHHSILALVEPFARRGRRVDLAACDRIARRIAFRPVEHPQTDDAPASTETLTLAPHDDTRWTLMRQLALAEGLTATLEATGTDPATLLAAIDAVPPARQLARGAGWTLAMVHRIAAPASNGAPELVITRGVVRVDGLALTMKVPTVSGISADISVAATDGDPITLPDDLLAVLGRDWGHLDRGVGGWSCALGLHGRGPARLRDAEAKLRRMAEHLATTLAEPPARYHVRLRAARWRVAARRSLPLLGCLALIGMAASVRQLGLSDESTVWMLLLNAPPLLLIGFFTLREMPRIELPRVPRALPHRAWRDSAPSADRAPLDARHTPT